MDHDEAREWLSGYRSTANYTPEDPRETWQVRIAEADAAKIQSAYWVLKAHAEGLMTSEPKGGASDPARVTVDRADIREAADFLEDGWSVAADRLISSFRALLAETERQAGRRP